jgi:AcrR family transcriptional regulator
MSRAYKMDVRQSAADKTRKRIIRAARQLLLAKGGFSEFTIDSVARQAGVARMTVYYQFKSKPLLLEALFDDLASRGQMSRLRAAFEQPDPVEGLREFIRAFCGFWSSDRVVIRRLRSLATLDPDVEKGLREREKWRRQGVETLVQWICASHGTPPKAVADSVDTLLVLLSFESFDAFAGYGHSTLKIAEMQEKLAMNILGLNEPKVKLGKSGVAR